MHSRKEASSSAYASSIVAGPYLYSILVPYSTPDGISAFVILPMCHDPQPTSFLEWNWLIGDDCQCTLLLVESIEVLSIYLYMCQRTNIPFHKGSGFVHCVAFHTALTYFIQNNIQLTILIHNSKKDLTPLHANILFHKHVRKDVKNKLQRDEHTIGTTVPADFIHLQYVQYDALI
mmetsp:Transcript_12060/g.33205  ORF Transcript_12060/g.33205 Transcript_12060/m.33205 type:complete len:176 (-) Transcript_12060:883-1410(-)